MRIAKLTALLIIYCSYVIAQGVVTTVAGSDWTFNGNGRPAIDAPLGAPGSISLDANGNPVFVDSQNCFVGRIGTDGILTVLAGNGFCGFNTGQGGLATSAALAPTSAVMDAAGTLYISDLFGIRKVVAGTISLFTSYAPIVIGGTRFEYSFGGLGGLTRDAAGKIYATDSSKNQVYRFAADGTWTVVAGNGTAGSGGDGGLATAAMLDRPRSLAFDTAGNMYIAGNGAVRKVSVAGVISTLDPSLGGNSVSTDGKGSIYIAAGTYLYKVTGGVASVLLPPDVGTNLGVVSDSAGNLYVTDADSGRIYRLPATGSLSLVAGNGNYRYSGEGLPATQTSIAAPVGLAVTPDGTIYFSEPALHRVRKVAKGVLTTAAGNGIRGVGGDGGPATSAQIDAPRSLAYDLAGNLYISDAGNGRIRKVTPAGVISTLTAALSGPIAVNSSGTLYVGNGPTVLSLDAKGTFTAVAGTGATGTDGDGGPATKARLTNVVSIAFDLSGNLLIADQLGRSIRKVTPQGIISTVAGSAGHSPSAVATDPSGNIYFSDNTSDLDRITPGGVFSRWQGPRSPIGDGKLASLVAFYALGQMASDAAGNLYITDGFNYRIRAMLAEKPTMQIGPAALVFAAASDGAPVTSPVTVQGSLAGLDFKVSTNAADGAKWLSVEDVGGSTPRVLTVIADPANLAPGTYTGTVTVTPAAATPSTLPVNVTFTIGQAQAPLLAVDLPNLSFTYPGGASARSQLQTVSNAGGGVIQFTASTATVSGGNWLTVSTAAGSVTPGRPVALSVTATPAGLAAGTYSGTLTITSVAGSRIDVPVTMTISAATTGLLLTQTGMSFIAVAQGGKVAPQNLGVVNIGSGSLSWTASASTLSGGKWLSVNPAGGSSDPADAAPQVSVSVDATSLAPGNYYGLVRIDAPGAVNTPQVATAFLQVLSADANPGTVVQPSELIFASSAGDNLNGSPSSQQLTLYNASRAPIFYRTSSTAPGGSNELFLLPQSGTIDPARPAKVVVQPIYQYSGIITFEFSDGRVQTVRVTNIPATGGKSTAQARFRPFDVGKSCTPTRLVPAVTTLPTSFTVSAGWPVALSVDVTDDCGSPHVSGSVTVTFSNGDAPLALQSLNNGTWQATWATRTKSEQISLAIQAVNERLAIQGTRQVDGSLGSIKDPPSFAQAGVVSAANPVSFTAIAPGSIFSIYGDRLAENSDSAQAIPLPGLLGNTRVIIGDKQAPLFYASQGQINAMVPYGLNPNTTHQLLIQRGLTYSRPVAVNVAPAQPGVFTANGAAIAFSYRGTAPGFLVTTQAPARAGDVLVLYCGGLGTPTQAVDDGAASPSTSIQDSLDVTVGGVNAKVAYAGLVAGLVGLYQVNLTVPAGIAPGDAVLLAITVSGQTSPPVTLAVR